LGSEAWWLGSSTRGAWMAVVVITEGYRRMPKDTENQPKNRV